MGQGVNVSTQTPFAHSGLQHRSLDEHTTALRPHVAGGGGGQDGTGHGLPMGTHDAPPPLTTSSVLHVVRSQQTLPVAHSIVAHRGGGGGGGTSGEHIIRHGLMEHMRGSSAAQYGQMV
jgi:hypothetical protein